MPNVDINSDSYECILYHLHHQCKHVDGTDFTPTVCTIFVETSKKLNRPKPQDMRENYKEIVISINKM